MRRDRFDAGAAKAADLALLAGFVVVLVLMSMGVL